MILKHDGSSLHNDLAIKQLRLPVEDFSIKKKKMYIFLLFNNTYYII